MVTATSCLGPYRATRRCVEWGAPIVRGAGLSHTSIGERAVKPLEISARTGAFDRPTPPRRAVISWALYDLANTIFSMNVVSLYFALWITLDLGGTDSHYGLANSASMAVVLVLAPLIGAISDQAGRRMPFLAASTLACVGLTFFLGTRSLLLALFLFAAANVFFQAGSVFYDALLADVSTEANRGRVGGLGVGLGYLGSFLGVGTGILLTARLGESAAKPAIFQATAVGFLLFSIPCFLFVRERRARRMSGAGMLVSRAIGQVRETLHLANRYPGLGRFLIGRVFYSDAVTTLIAFMGIYLTKEAGFSQSLVQIVLLVGIVGAAIGALLVGALVDRIGPRRSLNLVLAVWAATMVLVVAIPLAGLPTGLFWLVAPLSGIALGGTWSADRPYMLLLSPPRYLGQFFGLYSMSGRFASIIGPVIWAGVVDWLGWGRPAAVATLVAMIGLSYLILRPVTDTPRVWQPEDLAPDPVAT